MPETRVPRPVCAWRRPVLALVLTLVMAAPAAAQLRTSGKGGGQPGGPGPSSDPRGGGGAPAPDAEQILHVLDRITFGASQEDIDRVRQIGIEAFIRLQLRPGRIVENPLLATRLAELPPRTTAVGDPNWSWKEMYGDYTLRARYSNRQLEQVMTEFWSNHFDTGLRVAFSGKTGWYGSLVFDPATNLPHIAYYDLLALRPYHAWYDGTRWNQERIENTTLNGWYTSLAFDPITGTPAVAYYSERFKRLQYHTNDGTTWSIEDIVDDTADVGEYSSLAFDPTGVAHIAYLDRDNGQLKHAYGAPGAWTVEVVDPGPGTGEWASLAMTPAGNPAIAYLDATNQQLRYAEWNGAGWQIAVADSTPGVGSHASLAFDPAGNPAIAYREIGGARLRYVTRPGATWGVPTLVDGNGDVGQYASLRFGPAGNPAIAYYDDAPNYDLKLARWNPSASAWVVTAVEGGGAIDGEHATLAFHPVTGEPAIAYYNGSQFELRYDEFDGTAWQNAIAADRGHTDFDLVDWEELETNGFRANAFGTFRDLLDISAKSAAMMLFLNNDENTAGNGNENYARELLELHTLGVDGGYTQLDVETAARALTGWTTVGRITASNCEVQIGPFCYNHDGHDGTAKTILGRAFAADGAAIPANYMKQGDELLDFLSVHPETARFICGKLIRKFVADVPPTRLDGECRRTFLQTGGDITRLLETILLSPEFLDTPEYRLNKIRDPFEYVLAATRHLDGDVHLHGLWIEIADIGMPLFRQDVPTGWPEVGGDWLSSYAMLQRWRSIEDLVHGDTITASSEPYRFQRTQIDPYAWYRAYDLGARGGQAGAEAVVDFFVQRLLRNRIGSAERTDLINCLTNGSPATFDLDAAATPAAFQDMVGIMLGYPVYQKN